MVAQRVRYLLDSSVFVDLLRGRIPHTPLPSPQETGISSIVEAELWGGAHKNPGSSARIAELTALLEIFHTVDFDSLAAYHYGELRSHLERRGAKIGCSSLPTPAASEQP